MSAAFGQRRLSDNVLTTPGHRKLTGMIGSTVSSPGSAPGTPLGVGFPIRRHSSAAFAANRRYSSNALLSPSTTIQVSHHLETADRSCTSHYLWLLKVHWKLKVICRNNFHNILQFTSPAIVDWKWIVIYRKKLNWAGPIAGQASTFFYNPLLSKWIVKKISYIVSQFSIHF